MYEYTSEYEYLCMIVYVGNLDVWQCIFVYMYACMCVRASVWVYEYLRMSVHI